MRAEDLPLLSSPSAPTVHPSGTHAVVSVVRPDLSADAYVGQLWRVPLTGAGVPLRVTRGFRDTSPKYTADGSLLGFLRAQPGLPPQVAVVPADGGEPVMVTDASLGVVDFAFSEDGRRIAYTAQVPEPGRHGSIDGVDADHEDPRVIRSLQFEFDGTGYASDRRAHLFVTDVPDPHGEPPIRPVGRAVNGSEPFRGVPPARQLSSGDFDHYDPVWDGDAVLVAAARHEVHDRDLRVDLYRFDTEGGEPTAITDSAAGDSVISSPVVRSGQVFFIGGHTGADGRDFFGENPGVFVVPRSGGPPIRITDAETVHAQQLSADGDGVLGIDLVRGVGVAFRVDASGRMRRWELPGSVVFLGAAGGVRVAVLATPASPGEVVVLDSDPPAEAVRPAWLSDSIQQIEPARSAGLSPSLGAASGPTRAIEFTLAVEPTRAVEVTVSLGPSQNGHVVAASSGFAEVSGRPAALVSVPLGGSAPLTDFAAALRSAVTALEPTEVTASAPDGYPVHGWVIRPEGAGPHPALLLIHGGPFACFGPAFFDEAQVYARAGYVVLMCNPRGSSGYGQAHAAAIRGDFGGLDAADVLAFLDHCLVTFPELDAGRVGVMGSSYGGYLAAWLTSHESRFAGAVVERGYLDPRSYIGASDIGWYFSLACHGSYEQMDAQSPLHLVDQVQTPTLVIHAERDLRCPISTAKRYYTELRLRGVEAELLVFPGENHELSRSGTPHHRKARFEHILSWWARWLPAPAV